MLRGFAIIKIHKISETEIVACYGKKKTSNIEQDYPNTSTIQSTLKKESV